MITYPTDKLQKVLLSGECEQNGTPTPSQSINIVCNNGAIKARMASGLPLGYTRVQFINSTRKIELANKTTNNSEIEARFKRTVAISQYLYQSDSNSSLTTNTTAYITDITGNWRFGDQTVLVAYDTFPLDEYMVTVQNKDGIFINGEQEFVYTNVNTFTSTNNLGAFGTQATPPIDLDYIIHRENGIVIAHYVACKRNSDNVFGLYDLISNTFYTNNEATITGGADNDSVEIYTDGTTETVAINLFNQNNYLDAYCPSGLKITSSTTSRCYIIPCKPLTEYRFVFDNTNVTSNGRCVIAGFYNMPEIDMNTNQNIYNSFVKKSHDKTFTTDANINYLLFWLTFNSKDSSAQRRIDKTILYKTSNTATAEILLSVGDYKDTQEVLTGAVTRNIDIKVLDGTENWVSASVSNLYYFVSSNIKYNSAYPALCSHYACELPSVSGTNMGDKKAKVGYTASGTHDRVYIKDSSFADVSSLTTWLATQYTAGNPVIIVYPLATATTETVTPQPLAGNTVTQTTGSIDNLPIESSTIAELKKRYIGDTEILKVYIGDNVVWEK